MHSIVQLGLSLFQARSSVYFYFSGTKKSNCSLLLLLSFIETIIVSFTIHHVTITLAPKKHGSLQREQSQQVVHLKLFIMHQATNVSANDTRPVKLSSPGHANVFQWCCGAWSRSKSEDSWSNTSFSPRGIGCKHESVLDPLNTNKYDMSNNRQKSLKACRMTIDTTNMGNDVVNICMNYIFPANKRCCVQCW